MYLCIVNIGPSPSFNENSQLVIRLLLPFNCMEPFPFVKIMLDNIIYCPVIDILTEPEKKTLPLFFAFIIIGFVAVPMLSIVKFIFV